MWRIHPSLVEILSLSYRDLCGDMAKEREVGTENKKKVSSQKNPVSSRFLSSPFLAQRNLGIHRFSLQFIYLFPQPRWVEEGGPTSSLSQGFPDFPSSLN